MARGPIPGGGGRLDARVAAVETKLAAVDTKLDTQAQLLQSLSQQMADIDRRLTAAPPEPPQTLSPGEQWVSEGGQDIFEREKAWQRVCTERDEEHLGELHKMNIAKAHFENARQTREKWPLPMRVAAGVGITALGVLASLTGAAPALASLFGLGSWIGGTATTAVVSAGAVAGLTWRQQRKQNNPKAGLVAGATGIAALVGGALLNSLFGGALAGAGTTEMPRGPGPRQWHA